MDIAIDAAEQARALARIRAISRPIAVLLTVVLVPALLLPIARIVIILFFPTHVGSLHSALSFDGWNVGLGMSGSEPAISGDTRIPLGTLSLEQRGEIAGIAALCAACTALALIQLRSLFVLYSGGVVFADSNIRCIKGFGIWLVVAAIAGNVSGRLFMWVTHGANLYTANAALIVVLGAMIYVIAHVMELGRQADRERKDFI